MKKAVFALTAGSDMLLQVCSMIPAALESMTERSFRLYLDNDPEEGCLQMVVWRDDREPKSKPAPQMDKTPKELPPVSVEEAAKHYEYPPGSIREGWVGLWPRVNLLKNAGCIAQSITEKRWINKKFRIVLEHDPEFSRAMFLSTLLDARGQPIREQVQPSGTMLKISKASS